MQSTAELEKASKLEKGYVASIAFFSFGKAKSCCVASFLQRRYSQTASRQKTLLFCSIRIYIIFLPLYLHFIEQRFSCVPSGHDKSRYTLGLETPGFIPKPLRGKKLCCISYREFYIFAKPCIRLSKIIQ